MSQHNSFKRGTAAALKKRNVLKRFERVELLKKRKKWAEGDRVFSLPKTKPEA
ncbi:MAG TPA: small basic protein [Opitutae bacterium]|nr:small basic protein [Opitutae bacterium]|tara:strand:- start:1545 stop:1703 length:159 start_codon:yes stop_codon:yes gene_type:complete